MEARHSSVLEALQCLHTEVIEIFAEQSIVHNKAAAAHFWYTLHIYTISPHIDIVHKHNDLLQLALIGGTLVIIVPSVCYKVTLCKMCYRPTKGLFHHLLMLVQLLCLEKSTQLSRALLSDQIQSRMWCMLGSTQQTWRTLKLSSIRPKGDFCKVVKGNQITFVQAFSRHSNTDALDYLVLSLAPKISHCYCITCEWSNFNITPQNVAAKLLQVLFEIRFAKKQKDSLQYEAMCSSTYCGHKVAIV